MLDICGVDRTPTHNTHLYSTVCSQARNAHLALGSIHTDCSALFVCLRRICHLVSHVSHPFVVLSLAVYHEHIIFFIHSSFYHDTQNTQHNRDNKNNSKNTPYIMQISMLSQSQRHQESLRRENLQSGGNPRTTTPTGYEPKELATVSRIED